MKIINKQYNSRSCFLCGLENQAGLHMRFYETDKKELVSFFTPLNHHQSYPDRLHGGIITAVLDETMGRAIQIEEKDTWSVTADINVKFKLPVPLFKELKVVARVTRNTRLIYESEAEIYDQHRILATATARFLKLPIEKITDQDFHHREWLQEDITEEDLKHFK
ncbi:MAG: PaaI family thioesterase [Bacilli bacterium]|jgi:acyl-coenzyme A thioesterase PaaI-like protein|nr:PaaI family thioesterase [Bacilli bacterium]MDY0063460.1 PaaI family thioesterase [Bacilli bacterium]